MVYTLKTNRHAIATAREMDVGLDEVGEGGMEWKHGGRNWVRMRERKAEREEVLQSKRVKVVIKRQ